MNSSRRPIPAPAAPRDALLFCAVCQVSIARSELERGEARTTPRGRTFCAECATASPAERERRRAALEAEFADDAPISAARMARAAAEVRRPAATPHAAPESRPSPPDQELVVLKARVGELERAAFRLQTRVADVEEKLDAALRRLG